ncbi:MAG: type secretion system ATPase [Firmicutes bacterium]|nr:type secretion system ATPase [Bacillota bacterium]
MKDKQEIAATEEKDDVLDPKLQCFLIVAGVLQVFISETEVRQAVEKGVRETGDILRMAKTFRVKANVIRPELQELPDIPLPAIAVMKSGDWVVIGRNDDQKILVLQPGEDDPRPTPLDEFVAAWSGEVLTFQRRFSWQHFLRQYNLNWFTGSILQYKMFLGEVVVASFFLQLFALITPLFTQVVVDKVIGNQGISTLNVLGTVFVIFALFQSGMGILRTYLLNHTTNKLDVILGTKLFRHLLSLPLPYFEHRQVGHTLMRISALTSIREFLTGSAITVLLDTVFSVVFFAVMFYYSWSLTLIALAALPVYLLQNVIATPVYKHRLDAVWAAEADNNGFMVEAVTGIQTVKALAIEPQFNRRWEELIASYVRATFRSAALNISVSNTSGLVQRLSNLVILWVGGHMVMDGRLTLGQLIAFQMLAGQASNPVLELIGKWQSFQQAGLSMERMGDILNTRPELVYAAPAEQPPIEGRIRFEDVSFRYDPHGPLILDCIHLDIPVGKRVGIVGRSGSGKSTLTKLVQNFYIPEKGRVIIDDSDLKTVEPSWLRRQIGTVMQESYLFGGSIRDNIAMADPGADMEDVIKASQTAGAHEFILELPQGYDTMVGERGTALSGGQRQRIAIARALLTGPRIIIFDEATSALDYESERIITDNMSAICAGRTALIIAHRLSTVKDCDRIIVLDHGRIVEQGSHAELIAQQGVYQKLVAQQEG